MKCSVVLTTHSKPQCLDLALASIYEQEPPFEWEVIVVNDGPLDETVEVCKKYARLYNNFVYNYTKNEGYRNPSVARNVGYKQAKGEVIICQCDDIVHTSTFSIEQLTLELQPGEFLLSKTEDWKYEGARPARYIMDYCSITKRPIPFFFCGAILREDLYAVGGNDEEFVEPCYDDNWFADCIIKGQGLRPNYSENIVTHHIHHTHPKGSHKNEHISKTLYQNKVRDATKTGVWQASGGPWEFVGTLKLKNYIPKCMNFFWASSKLSWARYLTVKSFRILNPDWEINVYTDGDIPANAPKTWRTEEMQDCNVYDGVDYFPELKNLDVEVKEYVSSLRSLAPAHASDLFQWSMLSSEGGFFSDMDILYIKPIPYEEWCKSDVVYCNSRGYASIGFYGSSPNNPLFHGILCEALARYKKGIYQSTGAEAIYRAGGLGAMWNNTLTNHPGDVAMAVLKNQYSKLSFKELIESTVYPWAWDDVENIWDRSVTVPISCIGIHWFGGAPKSQGMNSLLTPDNVEEYPCTFSKYAKYYR
jgi:glycosyltransferase involved in cell wall biosynthesis